MRAWLVFVLMLFAGPSLAQEATAGQVLDAAVNRVIRPAMADFRTRASGLESAMDALCALPEARTLAIARQQFRQAALSYGRIEIYRLGPLLEDNRADRLLFWPDRKGIALRQVQAILAEEDDSATGVTTLAQKSAAVQGFGALEFVLFGTGADDLALAENAYRCRYGRAIAANIRGMAEALAMGWYRQDGVAVHLTHPSAGYVDYRTETEALEALVAILAHGVEAVRDQRLLPFLARGDAPAKPKQALFWRSDMTVPMIGANLEALRALVEQSGVAGIGEAGQGGIDRSIAIQFDRAKVALAVVRSPLEQALATPTQAKALADVVSTSQTLQTLMGDQLSAALDLSVGFSALDGD